MSDAIIDFAKPLLNVSNDDETTKKAIDLAVIVWNAFVLPKREPKTDD